MLLSRERILILDGAMGTMLQRRGLTGNSEEFNLSHPEDILGIHKEYIAAGVDIIETNSFGANRLSQEAYGLAGKAGEMAEAAARIARRAADGASRKVWVAGSMGPTGKSLTLAQDISDPTYRRYSFDDMALAYSEQAKGLIDGGVDALLLETCFDALNAKAAIYAIRKISPDIPIMVSVSPNDKSGRTLTGQTIEAFYHSVKHAGLFSFGLNCSLGAEDMAPLVAEASDWAECALSCYPNAGLPNAMGEYDESPEKMAKAIREIAFAGNVNIVGGCCGTTPEHVKAIAEAVRGIAPRRIPEASRTLFLSGLEAVAIDKEKNNFTNVGERTNVAGSRKFARLIGSGDYESALQVAESQIEGGASVIDINMDDAMLDSSAEMERFLRHVSSDPAVAKAAIMIDSSHWETVSAGLKNAQGKCVVNSISLKGGEEEFLREAREIKALGAAVIVIAFDEKGQATTFDRKVEICRRAYSLLTEKAGYKPWDIIFDVNVLPVGTGIREHSRYAVDFIEAVRWIKANLPGALTSGGISNLSFSFRGNNAVREAMHSVFLYHAVNAGLDMGIVNPSMLEVYDDIEPGLLRAVEDVILDSDPEATERLISKAGEALEAAHTDGAETTGPSMENKSVEERLRDALVKGGSPALEAMVAEALAKSGKAVDVIEGPLMDGMARVGELFGSGKMFLPQVVKSAKAMKTAVSFLEPYMKEDEASASDKPAVVLATVKGDVHDIGKNITGIVLTCNGFRVIDLGVMVPKEDIIDRAVAEKAAIIGVSGLITPSLYQMEELCKEMAARGMDTPLLVGGATTSALHTAVKLAPLYGHVFHRPDASSGAVLASRLVSDREATEKAEREARGKLRELYARADTRRGNGEDDAETERRAEKAMPFPAESFLRGKFFEDIAGRKLSMDEVLPYFDNRLFLTTWGMKDSSRSEEKDKLIADAKASIETMKAGNSCEITICARFDACHSDGDDIVAKDFSLPMLRQDGGRSLADFVAPAEYRFDSPMGMFAISVRNHSHHREARSHDYHALLERSVLLTLAEATSLWLDEWLKTKLPKDGGFKIVKPAAGYASCPDHSLKRDILRLLPESAKLGITLLDSCAMIPEATICGLVFAHPMASYPEIRHISEKAAGDYASRRGLSPTEAKVFLGNLL